MGEFGEVLGVRPQNPKGYVTAPAGQRPLRRTEFQCPCCDRVFTSDWNCEQHKVYHYHRDGTVTVDCLDPAALHLLEPPRVHLEPFERDGLTVWGPPGFQDLESRRARKLSEARGQRGA